MEIITQFCWRYSSSIQQWKNFENRLRFEKVITKSLVASFFGTRCTCGVDTVDTGRFQKPSAIVVAFLDWLIDWLIDLFIYSNMFKKNNTNNSNRRWAGQPGTMCTYSLFDLTCDFIAQYISSATPRPYQISYHPFGRSVEQISLSHLGNKHSHKLDLK